MTEILTRNWRWVALRGVVAILFGLLTFLNPGITLAALVFLVGAYALVDGLFMVVSAIASRRGTPRWSVLFVGGLMGITAGMITFFVPGVTAVLLLLLISAWAVVTGIAEIAAAIRLRKEITGEWMFVLAGLLAVAFGVTLMVVPAAGALALMLWIGMYALMSGALLVGLGFRLREWGRTHAGGPVPHPV